jgi:Tol biopolymer transport system component
VQYRRLPPVRPGARILVLNSPTAWSAPLDDPEASKDPAANRGRPEARLDSWKKIASYLKRDVSTVQRWERREGMPVHRHLHDKQGSVFAFRPELDAWWQTRQAGFDGQALGNDLPGPKSRTQEPPRAGPKVSPAYRTRALSLAVLAAVLLGGALIWLVLGRNEAWHSPLANARFTRLSDFSGAEQAAALSRDGKRVAFLADHEGHLDVWGGVVGSNQYRNLTEGAVANIVNPALRVLDFSADATLVTIWTRRADGSQPGDVNVLAVPVGGGPLRPYLPGAAEFAWSHDRRLVYHTTAPGDPLFVREPGGSQERRIYVAAAGVHCHFPIWSPDDAFVYFLRGLPPDDWDLWRVRPSGAGLEQITAQRARMAYPVMLDRRTVVYLATDADGSGPWMYAVDVERRVPHRISTGLESYTSLAASADGTRLVTTIATPRTSLWRLSLSGEGTAAAASGPSLVAANGLTPRFGPGLLLYVSAQGGREGVWSLQRGATREIWGSPHAHIMGAPALSPDGRSIAFAAREGDRSRLYLVDPDGGHARVVTDSLALRGNLAWSPDGQSLVSGVVREGEPRVMRIPLNGDAPVPLVAEYSLDPVWSPDGRFLLYSGADVGTTFPLRAAAADGRPYPLPSVMLTRGARRVAFLRDPQRLVILRGEIGHKDPWLLDLSTGAERPLAVLPADFTIGDFDISADGTEIVFDRQQPNSYLALIERPTI